MGIQVSWFNDEKTILIHHITGRWTIAELRSAATEAWDMMRSVPHTVDVLMDVSTGNTLPSNFIVHGKHIASSRPKNAGTIVIIGGTAFMKALYRIYQKTYGKLHPDFTVYFADDVVTATEIISACGSAAATPKQEPEYAY